MFGYVHRYKASKLRLCKDIIRYQQKKILRRLGEDVDGDSLHKTSIFIRFYLNCKSIKKIGRVLAFRY